MSDEIYQRHIHRKLSNQVELGEKERILLNKKYKSCLCFIDEIVVEYYSDRSFKVLQLNPPNDLYFNRFGNYLYHYIKPSQNIYWTVKFKKSDLTKVKTWTFNPQFTQNNKTPYSDTSMIKPYTFFFTDKNEFDDYLRLSSKITFKKMMFKTSDKEKLFLKLLES